MRPRALIWIGVAAAALIAARRWLDVVEVRGRSMAPTLRPGDRLLVERLTFRLRGPRPGDLVLAADPRMPRRELVKRVVLVNGEAVTLIGDNPSASTDSLAFGDVPRSAIAWRVVLRYARVARATPLRSRQDPATTAGEAPRADGPVPASSSGEVRR